MSERFFVNDALYGNFSFPTVIEELISSAPFQRLKAIHQGGAIFLVNPKINHTRYDHSIGVYWLVTEFGGSIEERAAALLHDLSHTAFSHVVDYVLEKADEDYHEDIFNHVISNSDIPDILAKHGMSRVFDNFSDYNLLERPLPELCADRIDYTLRDLYQGDMITHKEISDFIEQLEVVEGRFRIAGDRAYSWFVKQYERLNKEYFRRPEYLFANHRLATILKTAIGTGKIALNELSGTDDQLISLLRQKGFETELDKISKLDGFESFDLKGAAKKLKVRKLTS